jgi:MFS family permease
MASTERPAAGEDPGQIQRGSGMSGLIHEARSQAKPFLFVLAAAAALGGFLFGYDTGVISGALLFIKPVFHASALQQQSIIGSLLVGAVVGATASGYLAEAMSRKWTKVLSGCIYVGAALWSASASGATDDLPGVLQQPGAGAAEAAARSWSTRVRTCRPRRAPAPLTGGRSLYRGRLEGRHRRGAERRVLLA